MTVILRSACALFLADGIDDVHELIRRTGPDAPERIIDVHHLGLGEAAKITCLGMIRNRVPRSLNRLLSVRGTRYLLAGTAAFRGRLLAREYTAGSPEPGTADMLRSAR